MQPWHPGQSSVVSTGRLAPCNTPRNPYQETVKHTKPHSWETCRQIINLLGTIKAFRYFWLQIPVTHTRIQTSFFSPFEGFFPPAPLHLSISPSQSKLPLLSSGEVGTEQVVEKGNEAAKLSCHATMQANGIQGSNSQRRAVPLLAAISHLESVPGGCSPGHPKRNACVQPSTTPFLETLWPQTQARNTGEPQRSIPRACLQRVRPPQLVCKLLWRSSTQAPLLPLGCWRTWGPARPFPGADFH